MTNYIDPSIEKPYSDTNCIKKGWKGRFDWLPFSEWNFYLSCQVAGHSKNWSMGTLNIDIFFFALEIGPIDFYFAYRLEVSPPKTVMIGDSPKSELFRSIGRS